MRWEFNVSESIVTQFVEARCATVMGLPDVMEIESAHSGLFNLVAMMASTANLIPSAAISSAVPKTAL